MYICYNLSCVIHICAYMNVYIVHKVDQQQKGRKVGCPITALSFPKTMAQLPPKSTMFLSNSSYFTWKKTTQTPEFHLLENMDLFYIPDTFTQLHPFVGMCRSVCIFALACCCPTSTTSSRLRFLVAFTHAAFDELWQELYGREVKHHGGWQGHSCQKKSSYPGVVKTQKSLPENGLRQGWRWYLQNNDKLQIVHYWEFCPTIGSHYRPALRYLKSSKTLVIAC